jgi:hypothetical protein
MWWARLLNVISGLLAGGVAASTTSYESIATTTLGSSQATITFSSIPSTFKHLQVRMIGRGTNASNSVDVFIRYNGSTSTYYRGHQLYGEGTTAYASADSATASGYAAYIPGNTNTANVFGVAVLDVLDYADTNKNKTSRSLTGYDSNGGGIILLRSSLWQTTSAVNQIELVCSAGSFDTYSKFALYGIKG